MHTCSCSPRPAACCQAVLSTTLSSAGDRDLYGAPLLVLCNKHDCEGAASPAGAALLLWWRAAHGSCHMFPGGTALLCFSPSACVWLPMCVCRLPPWRRGSGSAGHWQAGRCGARHQRAGHHRQDRRGCQARSAGEAPALQLAGYAEILCSKLAVVQQEGSRTGARRAEVAALALIDCAANRHTSLWRSLSFSLPSAPLLAFPPPPCSGWWSTLKSRSGRSSYGGAWWAREAGLPSHVCCPCH